MEMHAYIILLYQGSRNSEIWIGPADEDDIINKQNWSWVILSFPLIQEGQLSVSGERMCTILVNRLED